MLRNATIHTMAWHADDLSRDSSIIVVNSEVDRSVKAVAAWIDELERADDWIDLPVTAAALIDEDRTARGS